ncbi:hypothetical protein CCDG5_1025 [[Clostridium] cellulosi]|uniref:Phosphatidylglycerol lysyltransferase n=1 Tax=[Clostridium] cellulosi TaxID=29343 RepID=A0A078KNM9_9FIRM|nr:hypothetical protein CCDG5_1025 [[Clostridium] cellulosi]
MVVKSRKKDNIKRLKIIGGVIITAVAFYFFMAALSGLNPSDLSTERINWWLVCASAIIFGFATFVRALVYPYGIDKDMSIIDAWQIVAVGNAANMVLPFRAGEGIRLAVFPKRYSAAKRAKLAFIPGMADIGVILLLSVLAVYIADFKNPTFVSTLKIAVYGFLTLCALLFIIFLAIPKTRVEVISYFNKDTLNMLKWVFLSWIIMLLSIWVGFIAIGYGPLHSIQLSFGAFAGMNIACLIPSSPGNLGVFEWSVIVGLAELGIATIPAKAAGLVLHIIQYVGIVPLGIILYIRFFIHRNRTESLLFSRNSSWRAFGYKK